jgi:hypothetical protein
MKRFVLAVLSVIALCSLLSLPAVVKSYYDGYANTNYAAIDTPVTDGSWTTSTEWDDAAVPPNLPPTFHWREKWTQPSNIIQHFLVEFFTDNTNDTGDYFQLCYDCAADGGAAPQSDDMRIDWVGHDVSGLTIYQGNGTGWAVFTGWTYDEDIYVAESIGTSPLSSNAHWIIEFWINKSNPAFDISGSGYAPGIRVAVYDASNDTAGVQAWPPTEQDVPSDWGLETGTTETIPEPLTVAAVVFLSTIAVAVSFYFLRKRPKNQTSGKTREISSTR